MDDKEIKLLNALYDVAENNIDFLSYNGQTKFNELVQKADDLNLIW